MIDYIYPILFIALIIGYIMLICNIIYEVFKAKKYTKNKKEDKID